MRRRISKAIELILIGGVLTLELVISRLPDSPQWLGTPLYYGLIFGVLIVGFAVLFLWYDTGEKTELDELEERMEQLSHTQTQALNRLANEIRKEREMWNAKFKQQSTM